MDKKILEIIFKFGDVLNERPKTAIFFVLVSYFATFYALAGLTTAFPRHATELAIFILTFFAFWSAWTVIPIVRYMADKHKGVK